MRLHPAAHSFNLRPAALSSGVSAVSVKRTVQGEASRGGALRLLVVVGRRLPTVARVRVHRDAMLGQSAATAFVNIVRAAFEVS
jgi:hypothetical protein